MTPLNCILSSSAIVKKDIIQFYAKNLGLDIYQDNKVTLDNNKVQKALN
jgi:signal transduction histidine kinase